MAWSERAAPPQSELGKGASPANKREWPVLFPPAVPLTRSYRPAPDVSSQFLLSGGSSCYMSQEPRTGRHQHPALPTLLLRPKRGRTHRDESRNPHVTGHSPAARTALKEGATAPLRPSLLTSHCGTVLLTWDHTSALTTDTQSYIELTTPVLRPSSSIPLLVSSLLLCWVVNNLGWLYHSPAENPRGSPVGERSVPSPR